nr:MULTISPECIES: ElyC/SanA/YdcF family protein [Bradyrhizobium]
MGVPNDRVQVEGKSRNTAENAAFSKALAAPHLGDR